MNDHWLRFDKTSKMCILDLETFNLCLSFVNNRPWQCGLMTIVGDKAEKVQDLYIKWPNCNLKIGEGAAKVTHYNQAVFDSKAIDEGEAFKILYEELESSSRVIIHNGLNFDLYLIREWYRMHGKNWKPLVNKLIDTNYIARGIKLGMPFKQGDNFLEYQYRVMAFRQKGIKTKLSFLGQEFNIPHDYDTLHEATSDIELNRKVWNVLKYQIEL